jgi:hypothetical protein
MEEEYVLFIKYMKEEEEKIFPGDKYKNFIENVNKKYPNLFPEYWKKINKNEITWEDASFDYFNILHHEFYEITRSRKRKQIGENILSCLLPFFCFPCYVYLVGKGLKKAL